MATEETVIEDLEKGTALEDVSGSANDKDTSSSSTASSRRMSPVIPLCGEGQHGPLTSGSLADVRLRILLCSKAWSLLIRSKMTVPISSMAKFPLVAVGLVFLLLLCFGVLGPLWHSHLRSTVIYTNPAPAPDNNAALHVTPLPGSNSIDDMLVAGGLHPMAYRDKRSKDNGRWLSLGPDVPYEGYVYSAFYDDRRSLGTLPVVRIIAVVQANDALGLRCEVRYKGKPREFVRAVQTDIGAGVVRHNKNFKEYIFCCHLKHEVIPETVGLVSKEGSTSAFQIPVEIPIRPLMRMGFGVCVSVTYWHQNPHQVVEWLELLRIMGVSLVTVYNNSLEHDTARVFLEYEREGFVDFRQSHNFIPDHGELTIHMHMSPVINDCMYRNMYRFRKIVVTDFDEIIIPRTTDNYYDMLKAIDQRQAGTDPHPANHYIFRNNYFFVDIPQEDTSQSKHLITLRHRMKIAVSEPGYAIKSIIDPLACTNMHNHYCWRSTPLYDVGYIHLEVEPDLALNQHYKRCHLDMWEQAGECKRAMSAATRDDIMLKYKARLEMAVTPKLVRLGLEPL